MSGSSPGQTSMSSNRSSQTPISGSYIPVPSPISTSNPGSTTSSMQQQPTPAYVSPYPPLPQGPTASAARSIAAGTASSSGTRTSSSEERSEVRYDAAESLSRPFQIPSPGAMEDARSITQARKQALIEALNEHRINTIGELRRAERVCATLGSSDVTQPMTAAWVYYVNSNSLLTELRRLTRNYPFSSECLNEGKRLVHQDPNSNRSWNYCWLVLAKVHTQRLIPVYARAQAARPTMWGGRIPTPEQAQQLTAAFVTEWNSALAQLLRLWDTPPTR